MSETTESRPIGPPRPVGPTRPVGPMRPAAPVRPAAEAVAAPVASDPTRFGRIGPEGEIFLITTDGEVRIAQWAAGPAEEGLAFYGRRYDDLMAEIALAHTRLRDGLGSPEQAAGALTRVREAMVTPQFVGDVTALSSACDDLATAIEAGKAEAAARRQEQRAAALAAREALVADAEALATSTSWKATGERFTELLATWQAAPRADRQREQELWKRFSAARATFDRARRQHFTAVDGQRKEAKAQKEQIIAEAEALVRTTDWTGGARAFRSLMDRWKAVPRLAKNDDDRLWARFRAAQDAFFAARGAVLDERSAGEKENLAAKEALLVEAEALLPVTDLKAAKAALRGIQERWERIGHVPRGDKDRIDGRLKRVEDAVRTGESDQWRRSNPETRARAEDTVSKFEAAIAKLEKQRDAAAAKGDAKTVASLESSIASTRMLLDAASSALTDFSR